MSDETKKVSEAKGPYKVKNNRFWWHVDGLGEEDRLNEWAYKLGAEWWADRLNDAYAAGRASRDGLREALEKIAGVDYRGNRPVSASIAMKALKDDGEGR